MNARAARAELEALGYDDVDVDVVGPAELTLEDLEAVGLERKVLERYDHIGRVRLDGANVKRAIVLAPMAAEFYQDASVDLVEYLEVQAVKKLRELLEPVRH